MKKAFFTALSSLLLFSCYQPERECANFKTGTFEFESYLDGELVKSRFVRSDSIEIDYFRGETDTSSIRWINQCEYLITSLHPETRAEEKPLHIKILTTDGNTYIFEYGLVGETQKQKGTAVKVE